MKLKSGDSGYTLIELLVGLLVGAMLLLAVTNTFITSTKTYRLLEARSYLVEGGRLAVEMLAQDIRQAGSWGCLGDGYGSVRNQLTDQTSFPQLYFGSGVRAFVSSSTGWSNLPQAVRTAALPNVPVLLLSGARDTGIRVRSLDAANSRLAGIPEVWESIYTGLAARDYLLAVNGTCEMGELFQLTSLGSQNNEYQLGYGPQSGITPGNQPFDFMQGLGLMAGQNDNNQDRGTQVYRVFTRIYFIGVDTSPAARSSAPGLMMWDAATSSVQMLVEDIHDLYLSFGTGANPTVSSFVRDVHAQQRPLQLWDAADWSLVRSVRYSLLAMSPENSIEGYEESLQFRPEGAPLVLMNRHAETFTGTAALRARTRN